MSNINLLVQESILDQPYIDKEVKQIKRQITPKATANRLSHYASYGPTESSRIGRSVHALLRNREDMLSDAVNRGKEKYQQSLLKKPMAIAAGMKNNYALANSPESMNVDPPSAASNNLKLDMLSNPKSYFRKRR